MRLVRYRVKASEEHYGIWADETVFCLPCLASGRDQTFPKEIEEFISCGSKCVEQAESLLKNASEDDIKRAAVPLQEVSLLAPIVFPPKIICIGLNYRDHVEEQHAETPKEPIIFIKPHTTIIGPGENIVKPSFVKELDYEGELAIVIGRKAKNVSVSEAKDCIFGYTILNDVSARDFQFRDKQWTRGKGFDTFAPTGPCITTADELKSTENLRIRTWVNDELRQDSTTKNMIFNVYEIVHQISRVMTLEPCDIIATGTPKGVGFAWKPQPKFLKHGDVVRIEIEGIGVLENIVAEARF